MTMTRTIGGDRLGSGKKMTVDMKTYERSTHDLSYIWRSTMSSGTLVPFLTELALPGDTFDIELDCNIMTHPTVGPLFGSYKVQLDVFLSPIRLYQGQLHNNKLGIGLNMASVKLPLITINSPSPDITKPLDNQQINPSCIFSYLGIRGIGTPDEPSDTVLRRFNAIPYLTYWDIYKNYYANKQEEIGAVIHSSINATDQTVTAVPVYEPVHGDWGNLPVAPTEVSYPLLPATIVTISYTGTAPSFDQILIKVSVPNAYYPINILFASVIDNGVGGITCTSPNFGATLINWRYATNTDILEPAPEVYTFPLANIDEMRENILTATEVGTAYIINSGSIEPYNLPLIQSGEGEYAVWPKLISQEGLALKTYQSDLFNNWIQTEWLDGENGINEITSIDTTSGSFSIDTLTLSKKVYDMLNRIAISGGTYNDWLDTVWTHERYRNSETPMYMGGLIKELVFQEVVSNAESGGEEGTQPLGTLAGKGVMSKKHKGGKITIKVDEPSYIMGIISLTPRVDYSQGNKWDVNLKTMDDLHKPALDEIGFQDLITDQMAWWDTEVDGTGEPVYQSAGKQPAWINYMTNVNQVRGNFAIEGNEMFMTLNRRYEIDPDTARIKDLTTYIDPVKFNDIFAQTSRDAQNFWTQIGVDITARRKMSAKIIPNL